jgi:hypothetical protein
VATRNPLAGNSPSPGEISAVIDPMLSVATDAELQIIEDVGVRAGLIWVCPIEPWTNYRGWTCGKCGRTEEKARHEKEVG